MEWQSVVDYLMGTTGTVEEAISVLCLTDLDPDDWKFEVWTQYGIDCCEGCSNWMEIEEMHQTDNGQLCPSCFGTE